MGKKVLRKASFKKVVSVLTVVCIIASMFMTSFATVNIVSDKTKAISIIAAESKAIRVQIVGIIAVQSGNTYRLKNAGEGWDAASYASQVKALLSDASVTTATLQNGLTDLKSYNDASTTNAGYVGIALTQLTGDLTDVSTPAGLGSGEGSLLKKVEDNAISYKLFVNALLRLYQLNGNQTIMYKEYSSGSLVRETSLDVLFNTIGDYLPSEIDRINAYKARLEVLLTATNNWSTTSQKTALIENLYSYGLVRYESAPDTGTPTNPPAGGGGIVIPPVIEVTPAPTAAPTAAPTSAPTSAPTAAPTADPVKQDQQLKEVITVIQDKIDDIAAAKNTNEAITILTALTTQVANQITNADSSRQTTIDAKTSLTEIAEKVLEKVNVETVAAVVEGNNAKVTVDQKTAEAVVAKIDAIIETAKSINTVMTNSKVDVKVEAVLEIKAAAPTKADVKTAVSELPSTILQKAAEKGIDKVAIDTGVAKISIVPDTIKATGNETVTISANKVETAGVSNAIKEAVGDSPVFNFDLQVGGKAVSSFEKPVEIAVPYTIKPGEDANKITVFYINDNGDLENVQGQYNEKTGTVVFTTTHFSYYFVKVNNVTFKDLGSVEWARKNIEVVAAKDILKGVGDGMFAPEQNITRAQFAAMIVRQLKLLDKNATNSFSDVAKSDWYYAEVSSAVKAGIITGRPDGTFAPEENITRQDMAVLVSRVLLKYKSKYAATTSLLDKFNDKTAIEGYASESAATAGKYGIINGKPGDVFDPAALSTRAEAAVIAYRLFYLD